MVRPLTMHVVVGAFGNDTGATDAGSVYVYDLTGETPTVPIAALHNPGPAANEHFGSSVAISGTRVVVGADQELVPAPVGGGFAVGSAFVYDLASATPLVPVASLKNPEPTGLDWFGNSVAISGTRNFRQAGGGGRLWGRNRRN